METRTQSKKEISPTQQELTALKDKSEMGEGLTGDEYIRMQVLAEEINKQAKESVGSIIRSD